MAEIQVMPPGNWDIAYCHNIDITGNIYENPELLERDKWQPIF